MFRQYRTLSDGEFIVVGGDCSTGSGDYSVCQFVSHQRHDVPLVYQSKAISTEMTNLLVPVLERIFEVTGVKPLVCYERNNGGVFEMERLAAMNHGVKFTLFQMPTMGAVEGGSRGVYGWDTNSATRPVMLTALKNAVDSGALDIYDQETMNELFSFVNVQTSTSWKAQAERGMHDDLVMALAIANQISTMTPARTLSRAAGVGGLHLRNRKQMKSRAY